MAARAKAKGGRPLRAGSVASNVVSIRCTDDELAAWTKAAGGRPLSEWLRELAKSAIA